LGFGPAEPRSRPNDYNVLWDLAVHDVSLFYHVIGRMPQKLAVGTSHIPGYRKHGQLHCSSTALLSRKPCELAFTDQDAPRRAGGHKKSVYYNDNELGETAYL